MKRKRERENEREGGKHRWAEKQTKYISHVQ